MRIPYLVGLLVVIGSGLEAQRSTGRCTGTPVDPLVVAGPVYRDCDVDRPARLRGTAPQPAWTPSSSEMVDGRCFRAEYQFVTDSLGVPDLTTLQAGSSNNLAYGEAVRATLGALRYEPALLEGRPVQQVVVYRQSVAIRVSPSATGGRRAPANC